METITACSIFRHMICPLWRYPTMTLTTLLHVIKHAPVLNGRASNAKSQSDVLGFFALFLLASTLLAEAPEIEIPHLPLTTIIFLSSSCKALYRNRREPINTVALVVAGTVEVLKTLDHVCFPASLAVCSRHLITQL